MEEPDYGPPSRKEPTVWMRAIRFHTYHGRRQDEGDIYLAHQEEVENIVNLKFAIVEPPPPKAVR